MAGLTAENEWLSGSYETRTKEEIELSQKEHRELCEKNKKEMTSEEYKAWQDFFD